MNCIKFKSWISTKVCLDKSIDMFLNFYILLKLFSVPVGMNLEFSLIKTTGLCTGDASLSKTQKPSVDAAQYCQTLEIRIEPKGMV